ncbi:nucleoside transporter [Novosphingobium mathurense]|uniref:Nucleoside transporter n=2 Tax=Novosphingobium mathurense TaxID=428990 RepID=A0A1U6IMB5_9SPHN|nr:nucleoside transporter [Novosphingobium mathurense]
MSAIVEDNDRTGSVLQGPVLAIAAPLSMLIFLEFFIFGAWFATLGLVLATHGLDGIIASAYLLSALAAILSPLLLGAIGDRYLPPRTVLAIAHLAGSAFMALVPAAVNAGNGNLTLVLIFAYMLCFQPTLGLVNAYSLTVLGQRQSIFPYIRFFGLIGWVVAGLGVGSMGLSASTDIFYVNAIAGLVMAVYAMTLKRTPPPAAGARFSIGDLVGVKAFVLFRERSFTVLMVCALMTSISLGVYNSFVSPYLAVLGISNVAGVLAVGQASEAIFVVTIPFALARLGMKWALFAGMVMWGVRFTLFIAASHGGIAFAIGGVALHGICNDYFIVIAAMYLARVAPQDLAAQAQGWLILMVSGFGQAIGSALSGQIYALSVAPNQAVGAAAWTPLWFVPIGLAVVTAIVWTLFFRPVSSTATAE